MANPGNTAKNLNWVFRASLRLRPAQAMLTAMALQPVSLMLLPGPGWHFFSSKKSSMQLPVNDKIELETMDPEAEGEA
ncbi:MAG: hypothetical protein R3C24_01155 [Cyanobacteriota/Melainabacteria group bacterium]